MTAPDMVSVIAAALAGHQMDGASDRFWDGCRWIVECMCGHESVYTGESSADLDNQAHAAHQARAVLAAISEAGAVEWGTGEGSALMTWRDRAQAERQSASATKSYDRGATWVHTNPPVVTRVTFPWERAE